MTAQELAQKLTSVRVLNHDTLKNADDTAQRFTINGMIKTFKRDPMRIYIPLKRGLYQYEKIESVQEFMQHFSGMLRDE